MFQLFSSRRKPNCDGSTRRDFLRIGALGLGGLMLPDLLRLRAAQTAQGQASRGTSVIWLWLGGGPTHIETFDPKMTAPAEFRSTIGAIKTNVTGIELGGIFPKMAKQPTRWPSCAPSPTRNSGHGGGTHWVMTGYDFPPADNGQPPIKPGIGSILSRHRGPNNRQTGLPTYVRLGGMLGDGPAWLGPPMHPSTPAGKARGNMDVKVTLDNLERSHEPAQELRRRRTASLDRSGLLQGLDSFETQAFDLILSRAREAFDITREDPRVRAIVTATAWASRCCWPGGCARPASASSPSTIGGWDMHGSIAKQHEDISARSSIMPCRRFVEDIPGAGLDKDILLVITGEFGRTPRINGSAGRDHWAPLSTLALAGGGLKMGQVVGESNAKAEVPKTHADQSARPDGHGVPRARHTAGPAVQGPERPAHVDDHRRRADCGANLISVQCSVFSVQHHTTEH